MHHLQANSSSVLIAGSETTSSMLSGVTYLLLSNPDALKKVTEEVRTSFKSEDEITLTSVSRLTYMLACLNEALRSYPPVPFGMPRMVPKGGATVSGEFIPENVSLKSFPAEAAKLIADARPWLPSGIGLLIIVQNTGLNLSRTALNASAMIQSMPTIDLTRCSPFLKAQGIALEDSMTHFSFFFFLCNKTNLYLVWHTQKCD